jgi:hypothetical protein
VLVSLGGCVVGSLATTGMHFDESKGQWVQMVQKDKGLYLPQGGRVTARVLGVSARATDWGGWVSLGMGEAGLGPDDWFE